MRGRQKGQSEGRCEDKSRGQKREGERERQRSEGSMIQSLQVEGGVASQECRDLPKLEKARQWILIPSLQKEFSLADLF